MPFHLGDIVGDHRLDARADVDCPRHSELPLAEEVAAVLRIRNRPDDLSVYTSNAWGPDAARDAPRWESNFAPLASLPLAGFFLLKYGDIFRSDEDFFLFGQAQVVEFLLGHFDVHDRS
jgi:hypothetical protein